MVSLSLRILGIALCCLVYLPAVHAEQTSSPTPSPTPSGPSKQCQKNERLLQKAAKGESRVTKAFQKLAKSGDKIVRSMNKARPDEGCTLEAAVVGSVTLGGDCNGDGEVKPNDTVAILDVIRGRSELTSTANCDVNADSVINRDDVEALLDRLLG